ncbi:MAG: DUF3786 domain-containing protein [Planctomycetes bacterium]|nr:DUF3786 domain-containing protein [Planctomycetota bacterium]
MPQPPKKQENIKLASELAWQDFAGRGLRQVVTNTGAEPAGDEAVSVRFLNETYAVRRTEQRVVAEDGEPASDRMAALILHYLTHGDGTPRTGREIGFAQVPGAKFYEGPFRGRIVSRIIRMFGGDPSLLLKCGMDLGGRKAKYGDAAMTFPAFPEVPVTIVVWRGDDEFPANANFVFDASIGNYLSVEDVVVVCEEIINRLSRAASSI